MGQFEYDRSRGKGEPDGISEESDILHAQSVLHCSDSDYRYCAKSINISSKLQKQQSHHQMKLIDGLSKLLSHDTIDFSFSELNLFKSSVSSSAQEVHNQLPQFN